MQKKGIFLLQNTNEQTSLLIKSFNETEEYEILGCTSDGEEGIKKIGELKPDIVIMELVLSGFDGLDGIKRVLLISPESKIIVLSCLCREEIIREAIESGAK